MVRYMRSRDSNRRKRRPGRTKEYDRFNINRTFVVLLVSIIGQTLQTPLDITSTDQTQTNEQLTITQTKTNEDTNGNDKVIISESDVERAATTDDSYRKQSTNAEGNYSSENFRENRNPADVVRQDEIDGAVRHGLHLMHELSSIKEPLLYKMGLYLDPNESAGKVAAFTEPNVKASLQAKYGYATVQASLQLAQRIFPRSGRQRGGFPEDIPGGILSEQCPLRGVPRCPPASKRYRTADGTCNNLERPWRGAALSPLQRFLPPMYEDGVQSPKRSVFGDELPSARRISIMVHGDRNRAMPSITLMFMQWGQFLDHDIISTATSRAFNSSIPRCCLPGGSGFLPPEFTHPECMGIPVPRDDWFLGRFGVRCMEFVRSAPATRINCDLGWREQINQATSFIDASNIYGSDAQKAESLRSFRSGQLQYGRKRFRAPLTPPDPPGGEICRSGAISTTCFLGGDGRFGEQPALTAMHTMWLRFHNKIARGLQEVNNHWSDEKVYQEARKIVGALVQHVTYREFLPIVLGPDVIDLFDLKLLRKGFFYGYDPRVNPSTENSFSTAAFRFGHSLVQNSFIRSTIHHRKLLNNVSMHEEQGNPENIWSPGSLDRLVLGLLNQQSQQRDEFISRELTNHLFQGDGEAFGMDLAAINIQRGRDHGIPSYTSWRKPCGLSPIESWVDLLKVMSGASVETFKRLYADVDDIDLYSGGLAERPVRGGMVGPVFACIIAQQFLNYRKGDRFWYENGGFKSSFTLNQLHQIRKVNFAEVICHSLNEIDTLQPFVFLMSDQHKNNRVPCSEILSFDLTPWKEIDFSNAVDFEDLRNPFDEFKKELDDDVLSRPEFQPIVEVIHVDEDGVRIDDKLEEFEIPKVLHKRQSKSLNNTQRQIGEYILETLDDFYYDSEEEEYPQKRKKKKKPTTIRPYNQRRTTRRPILISLPTRKPVSTTYEDSHWQQLVPITEKPQDIFDRDDQNPERDILVLHDHILTKEKQAPAPNYEVNINIKYVLPTTTKKPYLTNFQEEKPIVYVNLKPQKVKTKATSYPIYVTKPDQHVTGYQIKKATTKKYNDVPIYVSPSYTMRPNYLTPNYLTTKTYDQEVVDVDYDPLYEDQTTKRPYRPGFSVNKPTFRPTKKTTSFPGYLYLHEDNYATNTNSKPIFINKDPIDDVYSQIFQNKPTFRPNVDKYDNFETLYVNQQTYQQLQQPTKIDDKLDFKSSLLPNKLKSKDKTMVKISFVKSGGFGRIEGKDAEDLEGDFDDVALPELDGVKVVQIDVLPNASKYNSNNTKEHDDEPVMPTLIDLNVTMECSPELPKQIPVRIANKTTII